MHPNDVRPSRIFSLDRGGIIDTLLAGLFASSPFGVQTIGVAAVFVYTGIITYILLKVLDALIGLRVTADEETEGLDIVLHDERGYDL